MKILFYISGHGFGHATRIVAIMKAILVKEPCSELYVKTHVSKTLFEKFPPSSIHYYRKALDVGVVERDIFSQDIYATLTRYSEITTNKKQIVREEVQFIKREGIDIIVSDIPPIASDVGHLAQVPVIAIGNFCWDFIYEPYVQAYPKFTHFVDQIRASYRKTDLLLRLPFHHDMEAFPRQRDIPLVVRKCSMSSEETKLRLGISPDDKRPIIFLSLRMSDIFIRAGVEDILRSNEFLLLSTENTTPMDENKFLVIPRSMRMEEFPNIMAVSDLVISKLGYGMASECISAKTPLMYPPREDFAEYTILQQGIRDILPSYCIPKYDFLYGKWYAHISRFLQNTFKSSDVSTDGAEIAANIILSYLQ